MGQPFELFNTDHLMGLLLVGLMSFIPLSYLIRRKDTDLNQRFAKSLGWTTLVYGIVKHFYGPLGLGEAWQIWLPLHMCQVANFLIAYALITGKRGLINEVIYFWTFAGATMAMLTPDLLYGWPDPNYIMYVFTHGILILGALFFSLIEGFNPTTSSIWRVFKVSVLYMVVIFPINYLVGGEANYLYLRYPPVVGSLMDVLPAPPGHIPFVMLVSYLLFWMVYLPVFFRDLAFGSATEDFS